MSINDIFFCEVVCLLAYKHNTLNTISNWSIFKLIISDQALITLK